jgi:GT2 family glycosyltransferase
MTDASPPVALALLNWNGWRLTIPCLESLAELKYPQPGLFLCDNNSSDESVPRIVEWAKGRGWSVRTIEHRMNGMESAAFAQDEPRLMILRSPENRGFAGGTNMAMRYALASPRRYRYVWVLNTDTTVDPAALNLLVQAMEDHRDAASAQSLLVSARNPELLDSAGMRLYARGGSSDMLQGQARSELAKLAGTRDVVPVFGCCAAAALYRVESLRQYGLFDEMFFSGFEDVDLACRLQRHGKGSLLVARSIVFHIGGPSRKRGKKGWMGWLGHRNKLSLVARWYPRLVALPILLFGIPRAFFAALRLAGITLRDWRTLVVTTYREMVGGAPAATRRKVFRLGTKGVLVEVESG